MCTHAYTTHDEFLLSQFSPIVFLVYFHRIHRHVFLGHINVTQKFITPVDIPHFSYLVETGMQTLYLSLSLALLLSLSLCVVVAINPAVTVVALQTDLISLLRHTCTYIHWDCRERVNKLWESTWSGIEWMRNVLRSKIERIWFAFMPVANARFN